MKFENLLLRGLFVLCMLVCVATVGSMLFPAPARSADGVRLAAVPGAACAPGVGPVRPGRSTCGQAD